MLLEEGTQEWKQFFRELTKIRKSNYRRYLHVETWQIRNSPQKRNIRDGEVEPLEGGSYLTPFKFASLAKFLHIAEDNGHLRYDENGMMLLEAPMKQPRVPKSRTRQNFATISDTSFINDEVSVTSSADKANSVNLEQEGTNMG